MNNNGSHRTDVLPTKTIKNTHTHTHIPFNLSDSLFTIFHVAGGDEIFVIITFKNAVGQAAKKLLQIAKRS